MLSPFGKVNEGECPRRPQKSKYLLIFSRDFWRRTCSPVPDGEETMHIHGNSMGINAADLYSAAQAERAAAARRAADTRKKLARNAQDIEAGASPEEAAMIGQWLDSRHSQVLSGDEYHASVSGKDPDFG
jgi:hypothetical protein